MSGFRQSAHFTRRPLYIIYPSHFSLPLWFTFLLRTLCHAKHIISILRALQLYLVTFRMYRWDLVSKKLATTILLLGFLKFWNAALRLHFWVREKREGGEGLYIGNLMLGQATFGEKKIPQRPTTSEQATHTTVDFSTSSWHLYRIWSLILFVCSLRCFEAWRCLRF